MKLHPDFRDFLAAFDDEKVRYLIVGGYAVGFHARPRYTKDIDVWVAETADNRHRLERALVKFGAPPSVASAALVASSEEILWLGAPPTRIDVLLSIPGVEFDTAYDRQLDVLALRRARSRMP